MVLQGMSGCPSERQCKKCGVTKPLDQFAKNDKCKWGREHRCKACAIVSANSWTKNNRSRSREIKTKWRLGNPEKQLIAEKRYSRSEANLARSRAYEKANPEKKRTHSLVQQALKSGKLIRPKWCSKCSKIGRVHAHHADYAYPLEVTWLCAKCHNSLSRETRMVFA